MADAPAAHGDLSTEELERLLEEQPADARCEAWAAELVRRRREHYLRIARESDAESPNSGEPSPVGERTPPGDSAASAPAVPPENPPGNFFRFLRDRFRGWLDLFRGPPADDR